MTWLSSWKCFSAGFCLWIYSCCLLSKYGDTSWKTEHFWRWIDGIAITPGVHEDHLGLFHLAGKNENRSFLTMAGMLETQLIWHVVLSLHLSVVLTIIARIFNVISFITWLSEIRDFDWSIAASRSLIFPNSATAPIHFFGYGSIVCINFSHRDCKKVFG